MAATEVEKMYGWGMRDGRRGGIEVEKPFDIGDFNQWTMLAKVGLYPTLLRFAGGDNGFGAAEAKSFYRANEPFLPTMIRSPDWVVAAFRHPIDIPPPQCRPPKARQPSAMDPDLVCGTKFFYTYPSA